MNDALTALRRGKKPGASTTSELHFAPIKLVVCYVRELRDARELYEAGKLSDADLRTVEDRCILKAISLQEKAGLYAVSDGDFRRSAFHVDFLTQLDGVVWRQTPVPNVFRGWRRTLPACV